MLSPGKRPGVKNTFQQQMQDCVNEYLENDSIIPRLDKVPRIKNISEERIATADLAVSYKVKPLLGYVKLMVRENRYREIYALFKHGRATV